jgi:toxin ParE1/3/4
MSDQPRYQDQFVEAALEEMIVVELHFEQEFGLGSAFYSAMHRTIQDVLEFPEMMRPIHDSGMRRVTVDDFPVNVFYRLEGDRLVVYAVAHQSRKPFYWVNRLPEQ